MWNCNSHSLYWTLWRYPRICWTSLRANLALICKLKGMVLKKFLTWCKQSVLEGPLVKAYIYLKQILQRLDYYLDGRYSSKLVRALVKLAKRSGLYPECLKIEGCKVLKTQVAAGSFGDIYKGELEGQAIAVKVVRLFEPSEKKKLLQVSFLLSTWVVFIHNPTKMQIYCHEAVIWKQLDHRQLKYTRKYWCFTESVFLSFQLISCHFVVSISCPTLIWVGGYAYYRLGCQVAILHRICVTMRHSIACNW